MATLNRSNRSDRPRLLRLPGGFALLGVGLLSALLAAGGAAASGGTSIANAPLVQPGVQESGNTMTDATSQGSEGIGRLSGCWNDLEYWRLALTAGDDVQISGHAVSPGANLEIAVFPPGTTSANIANAAAVGDGLPPSRALHFTATSTGSYPLVAGPNCYDGTDGPFDFIVAVTHNAASEVASVSLPALTHLAAAGSVTASVRGAGGAPITDSKLVLRLFGTWQDAPSGPATAHLLATASPKGGSAQFVFHLPKKLSGSTVGLHVTGGGSGYRPVSSAVVKATIS
jgi:hypothetical protein